MDAVKHNAPDRPNDKYWQADKEAMNNLIAECINHLNTFANENTLLAEQAKVVRQTFMNFINNVVNPPENLNDGGKLELAAQFFTTIAQIYTLKEMSNHQPEQIQQQPQNQPPPEQIQQQPQNQPPHQLEGQNQPGQIPQQPQNQPPPQVGPQNPHQLQLEDQNQPEQNQQPPQVQPEGQNQLGQQNQPEQNQQPPQPPHGENPLGQNQQPQQNQLGQNQQPPQGQLEPLPDPQVEPLPNSWSNAQPVRNLLQQDPE